MVGAMGPLAEGALLAVARRPSLWPTAAAELRALATPRWWARWPPLPVPPPRYLSFRLEAMYGPPGAKVSAPELVAYLEWCRWMRALAR
jgi:hypothetical protein